MVQIKNKRQSIVDTVGESIYYISEKDSRTVV